MWVRLVPSTFVLPVIVGSLLPRTTHLLADRLRQTLLPLLAGLTRLHESTCGHTLTPAWKRCTHRAHAAATPALFVACPAQVRAYSVESASVVGAWDAHEDGVSAMAVVGDATQQGAAPAALPATCDPGSLPHSPPPPRRLVTASWDGTVKASCACLCLCPVFGCSMPQLHALGELRLSVPVPCVWRQHASAARPGGARVCLCPSPWGCSIPLSLRSMLDSQGPMSHRQKWALIRDVRTHLHTHTHACTHTHMRRYGISKRAESPGHAQAWRPCPC